MINVKNKTIKDNDVSSLYIQHPNLLSVSVAPP